MKAIIVAGGRGERLRPLTDTIPKPMVTVSGIPLLQHTIELLKKHGITDIIVALCYLPEVIENYFEDGAKFGVHITYTYEDPKSPLGTAGAILPAHDLISDTFIVTYADIIRDLDVADMIAFHKETHGIATLNVYKHTGNNFKSSLEFDAQRRLLAFTELAQSEELKDGYAWSNGSFYIFEPAIFDFIPKNLKSDFAKDIFPNLLANKRDVFVFPSTGYFIDIGTKETLAKANIDNAAQ